MSLRCDLSLLPDADERFVVVADTHYFADPGVADADAVAEFPSRRVQGERAQAVWETIAGLDPSFVVHMGDLSQEYPGRADFDASIDGALGQIRAVGLEGRVRFVAGNHDVGDKPDPTMPTHAVSADDQRSFDARFGPAFDSWRQGGFRFVTLNSQVLNTDLDAAIAQRQWLEAQVADGDPTPWIVFLHLPPYLRDSGDPHLGHYDTIAEPDRGWLLRLLRAAPVRHLFAAHVHFRFVDELATAGGTGRYWICASACFTRPGFGQLFAAGPAPERGRNDEGKLGFYLCSIRGDTVDTLFVPTGDGRSQATRPLTAARPQSRHLGVTFTHPPVWEAQVPVAYPSLVRQPVRNDYPWLLTRELGAGASRVPVEDLDDTLLRHRLGWLRRDGLHLQAVALGWGRALRAVDDHAGAFDRLEVQLPGRARVDDADVERLALLDMPVALCPTVPGDRIPGKQHPRIRVGFRADELSTLPGDVALVVCADVHAALTAETLARPACANALQLRLALDTPDTAPTHVTRGLLLGAAWDATVFVEPLIDLDRTMDGAAGLLDPLCNPRAAWETARLLGALLARVEPVQVTLVDAGREELVVVGRRGALRVWPAGDGPDGPGPLYDLARGTVRDAAAQGSVAQGPMTQGPMTQGPMTQGPVARWD